MVSVNEGVAVGFDVGVRDAVGVGVAEGVEVGVEITDGFAVGVALAVTMGVGLPDLEKVAVALWVESIFTVQVVCVPIHAPDHPSKREPDCAKEVRVTDEPDWNLAESYGAICPRLMPYGLEDTVPEPSPDL